MPCFNHCNHCSTVQLYHTAPRRVRVPLFATSRQKNEERGGPERRGNSKRWHCLYYLLGWRLTYQIPSYLTNMVPSVLLLEWRLPTEYIQHQNLLCAQVHFSVCTYVEACGRSRARTPAKQLKARRSGIKTRDQTPLLCN